MLKGKKFNNALSYFSNFAHVFKKILINQVP